MANLLQWFQQQLQAGNASGWQGFGQSSGYNSNERGQDIGEPLGTAIPGIAGVVQSVTSWGYGDSAVTIKDAAGNAYTVGHVTPNVSQGETVLDGQTIGFSRGIASPISSGPHVEVQVDPAGASGPVNPVTWIQQRIQDGASAIAGSTPGISAATAQGQQASGPGSPAYANIPVVGGVLAFVAELFGGLFRVILTILGIAAILIGLYILFRPEDAPSAGDLAKAGIAA